MSRRCENAGLILHTPTAQVIREGVIDVLRPYARGQTAEMLGMGAATCGTVMCVAGHYKQARIDAGDPPKAYDGDWWWVDGASAMADALGFDHFGQLKEWGRQNARRWQNSDGGAMFHSVNAYRNPFSAYASSLLDVCDHWDIVADALDTATAGKFVVRVQLMAPGDVGGVERGQWLWRDNWLANGKSDVTALQKAAGRQGLFSSLIKAPDDYPLRHRAARAPTSATPGAAIMSMINERAAA